MRTAWRLAPVAIVAVLLILDCSPRFMLGDSVSYLSTGFWHYVPPDRSWVFGYLARGIMDAGHDVRAFIVLQAACLLLALAWGPWFGTGRGNAIRAGVFAILVAADPLLEIYTRFYLSDLMASVVFLAFADAVARGLTRGVSRAWACGLMLLSAASVMLRVACAAQELMLLVLCAIAFGLERGGRRRLRLTILMLPVPLVSVGLLAASNMFAYGDTFGHRPFVNKLSGVFLMGVFSPALAPADFAAIGVPVDPATFASLGTADYRRRANQVWDETGQTVRLLLERRFGRFDPFDGKVDRACRSLVVHAALRDPWAAMDVALTGTADYFVPSFWRRHLDQELSDRRDLPAQLVQIIDARSRLAVPPGVDRRRTLLSRALSAVIELYPVLLAGGVALAVRGMLRGRAPPHERVFGAALIATIGAAGLYANFVIPRYVLPAVVLTYFLVAKYRGRERPGPRKAGAVPLPVSGR